MADRYWVGGTGTWNNSNTGNWSATSGGAGGASVPTSADTPIFDSNSGSGIVTFTNGGVTVGTTTINNSAIELSLGAAFTTSGLLTLTAGTFTTNGYNVTASSLSSSNSNTRTINLGSSTITLTATSATIAMSNATGLTLNAGTSQITCTGTSATLAAAASGGTSLTFYNVSFTSTSIATISIAGANTFNNLSVTGRTTAGVAAISLSADQTINGTLTLSAGTNATMRTFVQSNAIGTTRTLTCAAVASLTDIDFRDITIAGAAAPVSGTRLGDCKGNSGITFPAAKTVYWNLAGNNNWSATAWAGTGGGTPALANFPLAQDTAVFQSSSPASGATTTINAAYNIGTIDMSARTSNTMTLATATNSLPIYGNWINGTGATLSGSGALTFAGRGSQTITSAGRSFTQAININTPSGSVTLQDAYTSNAAIALTAGTLDAATYNVSTSGQLNLSPGNAGVRALNFGSSTWSLTGAGATTNTSNTVGLTVTNTGTLSLTNASDKTFHGGGIQTWPTINQGGTGTLTITGSNKFANITNTAIGRVQFTGGTTNEFAAFNLNGTAGNLLPLGSTNTTQAILKAPSWNVGANSTDGGNNTGLSFTAGGVDYLSISYINGQLTAVVISASISESSRPSDSGTTLATFNLSLSESCNMADAAATTAVLFGSFSDTATAAEVMEAIKAYFAAVLEATTASDLVSALQVMFPAVNEAAAGQDTGAAQGVLNANISDIIAAADSISGGLLFLSAINEATTAQEVAQAVFVFNRAVTEAASADEVLATIATLNAIVPEQVRGAEVVRALFTGATSVAETLNALDTAFAALTVRPTISETAQASEAATNQYTANPNIAELARALDTQSVAPSTFGAVAAAAAAVFDSGNAPGSIYNAALPVQQARATDSIIGAYLWNVINDVQNPAWVNTQTTQATTWTNVNDNQNPGWQNIPTM